MQAPPQLTVETAKACFNKAFAKFELPENQEQLKNAVIEARAQETEDPAQQQSNVINKVLPLLTPMLAEEMTEYGFTEQTLLMGMFQIQMLLAADPEFPEYQPKIARIMSGLQGKFD
mmetsp:Transcript_31763/g.62420  ORF Transcript_31763/g.62420 Transcript_31763/m.62420 type:complete len:117 (-) Transcript_31763:110-460(-)